MTCPHCSAFFQRNRYPIAEPERPVWGFGKLDKGILDGRDEAEDRVSAW